jgi:hemoglobin/transferrin/lactoferrin receptor protein
MRYIFLASYFSRRNLILMGVSRIYSFQRLGRVIGLMVIIALFSVSAVWAQVADESGDIKMSPITVTSTRVTRDLSEIPLSITVVGTREIEEKPVPDLVDFLRDVPGAQVSQGAFGQYTFSLRGSGSERTLVLVDGVKQRIATTLYSEPTGFINLDPSEIERIEVIKGPASALYGSDAIGGVINVITKKGGDKPVGGSVGIKYDGSTESWIPRLAIYGSYQGFYYRVSGSGFTSRDMILQDRKKLWHSDFHRENYDARFGYEWTGGSLDFQASRYSGWRHMPSVNANDSRAQNPPAWVKNNYQSLPTDWRNLFSAKLVLKDLSAYLTRLTTTAYYLEQLAEPDNKRPFFNAAGQTTSLFTHRSSDKSEVIGGSVQADFQFGDHLLIMGIDVDRTKGHTTCVYGGDYIARGVQNEDRAGYTQSLALFAQDEWRLSPFVTMTMGLRYTSSENKLTKHQVEPYKVASSRVDNLVGSLGLVYHSPDGLSLRAIVSQGFRAPTLTDQLIGGTQGTLANFGLEPETSLNFELGARYASNSFVMDLAFFYSHLKDAFYLQDTGILNPSSPQAGGTYSQIQNSDQATSYGMEIMLERKFADLGLTPHLSLTAMKYVRKYKNGYSTANTGVPKTWGVAGLRWERELSEKTRLYADASLTWSGKFHDEGETGVLSYTEFYDSGTRADFVIGIESGEERKFKAALNFRNIGDKRYEPYGLFQPGFHVVGTIGYDF